MNVQRASIIATLMRPVQIGKVLIAVLATSDTLETELAVQVT